MASIGALDLVLADRATSCAVNICACCCGGCFLASSILWRILSAQPCIRYRPPPSITATHTPHSTNPCLYAWLSICRSPLPFSAGVSFTAGNPPTGRPALPAPCQPLSYSQPDPVPKPRSTSWCVSEAGSPAKPQLLIVLAQPFGQPGTLWCDAADGGDCGQHRVGQGQVSQDRLA